MGYGVNDGLRQGFTGYERDLETGLDYAQARYYSSIHGRFTSVDSAGPDLMDPQTLNRYRYALNNPLRYVDPDGNEEKEGFVEKLTKYVDKLLAAFSSGPDEVGIIASQDARAFTKQRIPGTPLTGRSLVMASVENNKTLAELSIRAAEEADTFLPGVGPAMTMFGREVGLRDNTDVALGVGGTILSLIPTMKAIVVKQAGFAAKGVPIIIDNSLGVSTNKVAAALREAGINARTVTEIFGKDPGDKAIRKLASSINGRVVATDRGRQLGEGFGNLAIKVDGRIQKDINSAVRIVKKELRVK
jgi:RHS repeat-associated protein